MSARLLGNTPLRRFRRLDCPPRLRESVRQALDPGSTSNSGGFAPHPFAHVLSHIAFGLQCLCAPSLREFFPTSTAPQTRAEWLAPIVPAGESSGDGGLQPRRGHWVHWSPAHLLRGSLAAPFRLLSGWPSLFLSFGAFGSLSCKLKAVRTSSADVGPAESHRGTPDGTIPPVVVSSSGISQGAGFSIGTQW